MQKKINEITSLMDIRLKSKGLTYTISKEQENEVTLNINSIANVKAAIEIFYFEEDDIDIYYEVHFLTPKAVKAIYKRSQLGGENLDYLEEDIENFAWHLRRTNEAIEEIATFVDVIQDVCRNRGLDIEDFITINSYFMKNIHLYLKP